jgi:hypothetical protein
MRDAFCSFSFAEIDQSRIGFGLNKTLKNKASVRKTYETPSRLLQIDLSSDDIDDSNRVKNDDILNF